MDDPVDDDRLHFPPLDRSFPLKTYQIYSTEHAGFFLALYADLSLRRMSWESAVAMGAKKQLDLLWEWQLLNRGHCKDKKEATFELFILGEEKVLGLEYGSDGTKVIYLSSVDLSRCGYFYDPIVTLLDTGLVVPHQKTPSNRAYEGCQEFPACYRPHPLIVPPHLVGKWVPDAVWQLCGMMQEISPTGDWRLIAVGHGRVTRKSFSLKQRRVAALWAMECIYSGMLVTAEHSQNFQAETGI